MQILFFLINLALLVFAIMTGAVLLLGIAVAATAIIAFIVIRQKLTGQPAVFTRFYSVNRTVRADEGMEPPPSGEIIDAEYKEIGGGKQ